LADILVIGSVAWDEVVRLDQPLSIGSHNNGRWVGKRIGGGAANTGMALANAGDRPLLVSAVGTDPDGEHLGMELARRGLDITYLNRGADETTRSLVMLDTAGERTIVNLSRARVPLPPGLATLPADLCYVRSADPALTSILAERVRWAPVLAHVPPLSAECRPAQVLVGSASDLDNDFLADPFASGRRVSGAVLEWMVVTYGSAGARAFGEGVVIGQIAPKVDVADSTGAGDVFAAGLAHALARGIEMVAALRTAVAWASASVQYEGTVPPSEFPPAVKSLPTCTDPA
jgi:sugar/nucleoside kinase (ribokinase family)